ncbi:hypothetical protein FOZ60_013903 [Perkinsus olseni]|uniref:Uncharacterized protein n=1 Tax=Perkinsus olseni TaxID=32597 RepID=A0A7J6N8I2_PEROL|nr:hypothetical protein FOZ60_013903 [Perkinsus olseni]
MLNDPLEVGWNTLDTLNPLSDAECTSFDVVAFSTNILAFALFVLGIADQPYERPLFASMSPITFFLSSYWTPVSDCRRFDPAALSLGHVVVSGSISVIAAVYITAAILVMPGHIFSTKRYKLGSDEKPEARLITSFPYNLFPILYGESHYAEYHVDPVCGACDTSTRREEPEAFRLKGPRGEFGPAYDRYAMQIAAEAGPPMSSSSKSSSILR